MSDLLSKLRAFYENAETDECLGVIRDAIEELERLYAERRWIPVSEEVPEDGDDVLVSWGTPESELLIAHWRADEHGWFDDQGKRVPAVGVTHWMPLPEPPEVA